MRSITARGGAAAAIVFACVAAANDGQPTSAWTNGGASTTATVDGKPAAAATAAAMPYWQAPALPTAVIQGGVIPPGWQPQAVPYQGLGPDGQPITMYFAPTYVFTYQAGPPVVAQQPVNRPQARAAPQAVPAATTGGWNYATSGAPPVATGLPPGGYTQYRPVYQFPADARALSGTPLVPPGPLPQQAPLPPQAWAAATPQQPPPAMYQQPPYQAPVYGPPPNQWVPASPQAAAVPPPPADQWAAAAPFAAAGAAAGYAASQPTAPPVAAINSPTMAPVPPPQVPVQPASLAPPSSPVAPANTHRWRVVGVYDGDTLTCLDENNQQQKVRLAEIDAPESGQDYGKVSREALAGMVFGRTVDVVDQGRDRYGRWVAHISVGGLDVNRQMIASGNAWHYTTYSNDASLAAAQQQAQAQRLGLWAQQDPVPPWEYRKNGQ
jgi:endonuclease YncB( thermonuclease family)